jgi:hypothetical protein
MRLCASPLHVEIDSLPISSTLHFFPAPHLLPAPFNTSQIRSIKSSQVTSRHVNAFHIPTCPSAPSIPPNRICHGALPPHPIPTTSLISLTRHPHSAEGISAQQRILPRWVLNLVVNKRGGVAAR